MPDREPDPGNHLIQSLYDQRPRPDAPGERAADAPRQPMHVPAEPRETEDVPAEPREPDDDGIGDARGILHGTDPVLADAPTPDPDPDPDPEPAAPVQARRAAPSQTMTREVLTGGVEVVRGTCSVVIPAGQCLAVQHIGFVPALSSTPEMQCDVVDGEPVTLHVAKCVPFGARIEVRSELPVPDDTPASFHFQAVCAE